MTSLRLQTLNNTYAKVFCAVLFLLVVMFFVKSPRAYAAYDGARLIDNNVFLDSNSMSAPTIQQFLVDKGGGLASRSFVLTCGSPGDAATRQAYINFNAPCGQTVSAANIIYYAAQIYGVSPRVILATMQKEQSLTTAANPTDWQVDQAMGYGCPDSGGCGASSFFYQIDNGTWALRYHYERANNNTTWWNSGGNVCGGATLYRSTGLYAGATVTFKDEAGVGYATYTLANAATASFYCYTPHAYNNPQGLYDLPAFGTTGMYYSGSYNFVLWYERWFGTTYYVALPGCVQATNTSIACVWGLRNAATGEQIVVTDYDERNTLIVQQGAVFDSVLFYGNVNWAIQPGNLPVYRLKKANGATYLTTSLTEKASLVTSGYTYLGVGFYADPAGSNSGYPVYKMHNVTLNKFAWVNADAKGRYITDGYVDEGNVFNSIDTVRQEQSAPANQQLVYRFSDMPGNSHFWTTDLAERDRMITSGYKYEGVAWKSSALVTTKKVYRLYSQKMQKHLYTLDENEKNILSASGFWAYEGISQYMSDTPTARPVYRLYSPVTTNHLWTTDANEKDILVRSGTFRDEGIAWYQP